MFSVYPHIPSVPLPTLCVFASLRHPHISFDAKAQRRKAAQRNGVTSVRIMAVPSRES